MSDHRTFLELAAQAIDFELTPADAQRLRAHLAGCESCRTVVRRMRADAEALREFGWLDAPSGVEDAVTDAALRGRGSARSAPRLWAFALVGALLTVGLAGGLLGGGSVIEEILGDRTPGPSLPPATATTAAPASQTPLPSGLETPASPTVVPSGFGLNLAWSVTTVPASGTGGARMEDVVIAGGVIVAVGEDHRDGQRRAAVWTSADGATWTETILDAGSLHAITAFGGGFVAVGDGVSARSSDGSSWSWTEWQGADGGSQIDVAAGPGGVVSLRLGADGPASIDVLFSSDGSSWRATGTLDGICDPAIAGDATAYLIVANDCGTDPITAQIRRSLDGVTWSTVEPGDAFVPQAAPATVAAAGPGFVAGGFWRDAERIRQAFWSSADGQTWRRRGTFAPPGGTEEIRDVAALGDGAIAVGLRDPGTANAPAAWASPDGVSWARAAPLPLAAGGEPGTQTVNAVVGGDRLVVAVGWLETTDGERPVAWAAPTQPAP